MLHSSPVIEIPGYTILRPLGQGGMAVVYLALQQSLGREVALKVLAPALAGDAVARERFLREARIAAQLHHPHIVAIHDVGEHAGVAYMAIAYEPGGTAAPEAGEPIDPMRVLGILRDVAVALDYAHARGVVHRDVKPENILLRHDGSCVLSDFGIARAAGAGKPLTREDASIGTPHYMSPEQLRGEKVDGRADLYSLGVVMFQLLTGELPYTGTDGWAIGMQHLSASVPHLPASLAHLQPLLDALMSKDPEARPQTGSEVVRRIDELRAGVTSTPPSQIAPGTSTPTSQLSVAAPPPSRRATRTIVVAAAVLASVAIVVMLRGWSPAPPSKPSIAVLPFVDMSQDRNQGYFSDGIAEEMIDQLAKVEGLNVAGRTSTFSFKGTPEDLPSIGQKLHVDTILEGSVRTSGDRVRITAQLIKVSDGFHLWSQTYDRQLTDIFSVQDDIAGKVVKALKGKLLPVADGATAAAAPVPPPEPVAVAEAPPAADPSMLPPMVMPPPHAPAPDNATAPPVSAAAAPRPSPVPSGFKRSYAKGLEAAQYQDWSEVEVQMRAALEVEPTPAANMKLYGLRSEPYLPKLFLGIAAYKRGDCAAAVPYLQDPATRAAMGPGQAFQFADYVSLTYRALHECRQRGAGAKGPA